MLAPCGEKNQSLRLLTVGNPDILDLGCMIEEPAPFGKPGIEPVDRATFIGQDLLQISSSHRFRVSERGFLYMASDGDDVVVFHQGFEQLRDIASHDVYGATGEIAGIKELIEIASDQRIFFRGDGDDGIAHGNQWHDKRHEPKKRRIGRTDDSDCSNGLVHRNGDVTERWIVHGAVEFVSPRSVGKDALDSQFELLGGLLCSDDGGEATDDLVSAEFEIFSAVIENLSAIMSCRLGPCLGFARGLDRVADVFAVAERSLAKQSPIWSTNFHAVSRIRTGLLAADVELDRAVDDMNADILVFIWIRRGGDCVGYR